MTGERGVSSVVSTVLMVGIVVLIAIPAGIYAFQVADPGSDPAPQVHRTNASMTAGADVTEQTINVTHGGGDTIDMENVEVVVRLEDAGDQARIVNLPTSSKNLSSSNIAGDDIVSESYTVAGTPLSTDGENGEWSVDETVSFQLDTTSLSTGETVTVTFVHTETNSVLGKETFTASA
jgi:flagellin-like protein